MGLLDRIFGNEKEREAPQPASATTQFHESEPDSGESQASRNAPRRELVQVVLRDAMRKHGIPSDWIECRMLSTVSRGGRHGLHVNFVVKQAHDRLLAYVFAFQDSFEHELARYDQRARDWLLSIGWEFQGFNAAEMPDPRSWAAGGPAPLVDRDWKAPQPSGFDMLGETAAALAKDGAIPEKGDDEIERDLQALFAIRDAAMKDTRPEPEERADFQPTQPFDDSGNAKR